MKRIRELDGLRFFAILGVLCVHYRPPFRPSLNVLSIGWIGVDLFFVISGFLITNVLISLKTTTHPYRVFYWRRALRIFPAYYLVLIGLLAAGYFTHLHFSRAEITLPLLFLSSFQESYSIHQVYAVLLHGHALSKQSLAIDNHVFSSLRNATAIFWSLSFEEIFYLLWAPIVLHFSRRVLVSIAGAIIVISPFLRLLGHDPTFRECFSFPFRFDSLAMGSLLALILIAYKQDAKGGLKALIRGLKICAVASLIFLIILFIDDGFLRSIEPRSTLSFSFFGYSLLGVFFACIIGLCALFTDSSRWWAAFLRNRVLIYIGTVSYMIYLVHIPAWIFVYRMIARFEGHEPSASLALGMVAAITTVAIAALSWIVYERPILSYKNVLWGATGRRELTTLP